MTVPGARRAWRRLFEERFALVRNVSGDPLLPDCLRIAAGTDEENAKLAAGLRAVLAEQMQKDIASQVPGTIE